MVPPPAGSGGHRELESGLLLRAYASGYFPMADSRTGPIRWYSPDPRAVIPLDGFKVTRSLRQTLKKGSFEVRTDTAFEAVMRGCASRQDTWISEGIVEAYAELHRLGGAHSVEAWRGDGLAGGLYGVSVGGAFFGESMFSVERNASKVALVALVERLRMRGFGLLDIQFMTPHLARFGAVNLSRETYLATLKEALSRSCTFAD
jgi:leucyl/phenylalanyl-tRNA--protein transferase